MMKTIKMPCAQWSTLLIIVIFFIWTSSFLWPSIIGLDWINRIAEVGWLAIVFIAFINSPQYRSILLKLLPFISLFGLLLTITFLFDDEHSYKIELYSKTFLYSTFGFIAGIVFAKHFKVNEKEADNFLMFLGWSFALLVILYSFYAAFVGWNPSISALQIEEIGQYYQGISRLMAVSALILVTARAYLPTPVFLISFLLCVINIVSLGGIGALSGLVLAIFWLLRSFITDAQRKIRLINILYLVVSFSLIVYVTLNIDMVNNYNMFVQRIIGKIYFDWGEYETRPWLMLKGLEMWSSGSIGDFIFGPGPIKYCNSVGYVIEYRHPHNLFVGGVVWFGLFSIVFGAYVIVTFIRSVSLLFLKHKITNFVTLMFINYFLLSMVGGDFEQNRHFFFMLGAVNYYLRNLSINKIVTTIRSQSKSCRPIVQAVA